MAQLGNAPSGAVLFVNTKARRGQEWYESSLDELGRLEVKLDQAKGFSKASDLIAATADAIRREVPLVIVGGGDGTLSAVSGLFVHSSSRLCVLPLGTGNAFARDLGIPQNVRDACEVVRDGQDANVDIGKIAGQYFVNVATVGLSTRIAANLNDAMKRKFGRLVYLAATLRAIRSLTPFRVTLETENGIESFETIQVVIGNGRFHAGPFPVLPDASILEGKLSVYGVQARSRGEILRFALFLPGAHHARLHEVHTQHCKGGRLLTSPNRKVTVDGQIVLETPVDFTTIPGGLPVRVGKEFAATQRAS